MGGLWADCKSKVVIVLKRYLLLFYATTRNHFSGYCDRRQKVDFIWQLVTTSSMVGPRRSSQSTSQNQTCTKKRSWSLSGGLLLVFSFLNTGKALTSEKYAQQISEMHWKLQRLQPGLVNRMVQFCSLTVLHHTSQNQHLKSWTNWAVKFCLIHYIHLTSLVDYHVFKHLDNFLQGKCYHSQQEAENVFQEFVESWSMNFYIQE